MIRNIASSNMTMNSSNRKRSLMRDLICEHLISKKHKIPQELNQVRQEVLLTNIFQIPVKQSANCR